MSATHSVSPAPRRRSKRGKQNLWGTLLRGLLAAIVVTMVCVLVFALFLQWLRPSDNLIRIVNQLIKLGSIFAGVRTMLGRSSENRLITGALLGLIYMALGVGLYALLSGQQLHWTAYLSDIAMGIAGGGISGALIQGKR